MAQASLRKETFLMLNAKTTTTRGEKKYPKIMLTEYNERQCETEWQRELEKKIGGRRRRYWSDSSKDRQKTLSTKKK